MKIKFIGVGSAFTTADYYQSNMLITATSGKRLLLDCGSDIRFTLAEHDIYAENIGEKIDAVYISHLHADHIGGMEWLAFNTYFAEKPRKLPLFMEAKTMEKMWENALKGGLECMEGQLAQLSDYFDCHPLGESDTFNWEGIEFTLVKFPHIITGSLNHYSYGLWLKDGLTLFVTTDTQFQPDLLAEIGKEADVIFHDCETTPSPTTVHAHYEELCTLKDELKQKMWLYHYQPKPAYDPKDDGFKGFVVKGQEFDSHQKVKKGGFWRALFARK